MSQAARSFQRAVDRWAGVGPYYAMFPSSFADHVVKTYTEQGQVVLDPFAGRGTSLYSAVSQGREAVGIELNPVGWVYARTKLNPAPMEPVIDRLKGLVRIAANYRRSALEMPAFFRSCFDFRVRQFLLAARARLDWRYSAVDRTTMAFLLVYLHGKRDASLSNQMRQTKSMSPQYAVRWWRERNMKPPCLEPDEFLTKRIEWRYAKGIPDLHEGRIYLGDCRHHLAELRGHLNERSLHRAKLLFTSPPYYGLTNYHYDQWLRLWLLGGPPHALRTGAGVRGKYEHRDRYQALLLDTFRKSSKLLRPDAVIYVRTDVRRVTYKATRNALREVFPSRQIIRKPRPFEGPTQTRLFGDYSSKKGEVDLILLPEAG